MAVGIMLSGLLAAVFGTTFAIVMGLNLGHALFVYGLFGICGGILACIAGLPILHNAGRHNPSRNRTIG